MPLSLPRTLECKAAASWQYCATLLDLCRPNHVGVGGELAGLARTGREWRCSREGSPVSLEHERERFLARAVARSRKFNSDCMGKAGFYHTSNQRRESPHRYVFRSAQRRTTLAIRRHLEGGGTDRRRQSALHSFARDRWAARYRLVRLGGCLLLRLRGT
jgi:hypothetical protein